MVTQPATTSSEAHPAGAGPAAHVALILRSVWTVLEFEFRKSRTWKRMLVWGGVSIFPALIIFLMLFAGDMLPRGGWITIVFVMACEMVVILNALLWVAPIVQTELEGKTWLYIVTRPYGRFCLVLGKLLNGLIWTLGAGLLALALVGGVAWSYALPIEEIVSAPAANEDLFERQAEARRLMEEARRQLDANPELRRMLDRSLPLPGELDHLEGYGAVHGFQAPNPYAPEHQQPFESAADAIGIGLLLAALAILAGLTYCSLFCGIGCIIPGRAMLIAFSYTLVFETIIAFVPAIINRLTIQYHLRCLLNRWVDLEVPQHGQELFFSDWPAWWHLAVLGGMIVFWQIVSLLVIHYRQYVMTDET